MPNVVYEARRPTMIFTMPDAWYDPEAETIHIVENLKPKWLAILHELGHWFIEYLPQCLHWKYALHSEYDCAWEGFGLSMPFIVQSSN